VTTFSLPNLQIIAGPGDLPVNLDGPDPVAWGSFSFYNAAEQQIYLYAHTTQNIVTEQWLARAPFSNPTQLEYFTTPVPGAPEWSTSFADAKPLSFTKLGQPDWSPLAQLTVVPNGNRWLAVAFEADVLNDNGQQHVLAWESDTPRGPWAKVMDGLTERRVATWTARTPDQIAYGATLVALPGAGRTVIWSVNDLNMGADHTLYRGEFHVPSGLP
jgi:hypothetical protein